MSLTNAKIIAKGYDSGEYRRQDAKRGDSKYVIGRSDLGLIASNPRKWVKGFKLDDDGTDSTEWGTLLDTLILDSGRFNQRFAVRPDKYKKTVMRCPNCGSEAESAKCSKCKCDREPVEKECDWSGNSTTCQEWLAPHAGKIILKNEDMANVNAAVKGLDEECERFIADASTQVYCTADWKDGATGIVIPVKILLDIVPDKEHPDYGRGLGDLKTARDASPREWTKAVYHRGYAMQAALYTDVYVAATGEDRCEFYHVISENTSPYYAELRRLDLDFVELGRSQYRAALAKYAQCLSSGKWPGYFSQTVIAGVAQIERESYMIE
jgi:hypothetical protein